MQSNNRLGIILMMVTTVVFAAQDGISKHLAQEYNVLMVVMIRYWFFAAFVMTIAARKAGGLRSAAATSQPLMQGFRAVLLVAEICVMIYGFTLLGLVESHAVFAAYPLLIAALSGPVLGESVGWRRWAAIAVGFVGATASFSWFIAMTLQQASIVKAVAQVEMLFTIATSVLFFREKITRVELLGCGLVVCGVLVLLFA